MAARQSLIAASTASAPLFANVTRQSPSGATSTSRAASWPAASSSEGCTKLGSPRDRKPRSARQIVGGL